MSITKEELEEIIKLRPSIERVATLSSDGRNLLMRVPKEFREHFGLVKGDKIKFIVDFKNNIGMEILKK